MEPIKARTHREIAGTLNSITLSRAVTSKYYASLLIKDGLEVPVPKQTINVEMGLTLLAIDSRSNKTVPRFLKLAQSNLRRKQQALSRCQKGSKGLAKDWLKRAKSHECLANARANFQHNLSRQIIDETKW